MKNWKTTLFGAIAFLPQILPVILPSLALPDPVSKAVLAVFGALAFLCAKDNNVTGGTVKQ